MRSVAVIAIAFALLGGCAAPKRTAIETTLPFEEVVRRVAERNRMIRTLQGDGTITVESPEGSNSGSFEASLRKPDSLRVEFGGPFGLHVGTMQLTPDHFLFYNSMENRAYLGRPDGTILQSMFRLRMDFDEIINVFTGEFPPQSPGDSLLRFYLKDNTYVLAFWKDNRTIEYYIDGFSYVVSTYRIIDNQSNATLTAFALNIEETDGIAMPMLLRVIFPRERRSVTIAYDEISLNGSVDCSYAPPGGAEVYRY